MKNYIRNNIIGFYRKCDFITMTSIVSALTGIFLGLYRHFTISVICLIICGLCDAFDGKVARMYKYSNKQKKYGQELDSLSDVISFGIFPAVLTCLISDHFYVYLLAILYVLFGAIRLAYFNMLVQVDSSNSKSFIGVPITTVSISYPLFFFLLRYINYDLIEIIMPFILFIQGISFIIKVKIPKYDIAGIIVDNFIKLFNKKTISLFWFPFFLIISGNLFFYFSLSNVSFFNQFSYIIPFAFSLIWLCTLNLAIYLLVGSSNKSKIIMLIVTCIILVINDIKFMITKNPLEISDINYLNPDNVQMMGMAGSTFGSWIWITIIKALGYLLVGSFLIFISWKDKIKPVKRLSSFVYGILLIIVFALPLISNTGINSFLLNKVYFLSHEDIYKFNHNVEMYEKYGFYQGFMLNSISNLNLMPEGYNAQDAIDALEKSCNIPNGTYKKANVIFILSESFTDMPKITGIEFDKPLMSTIDNLKQTSNAKVSDLLVSIYGGNSVNTEFQILTGASLYFWKDGYIPYNQFYNDYNGDKVPNLIKEFNNNGYTTVYLTPWGSASFNSKYVYNLFGADKTIYDVNLKGKTKGYYYDDEDLIYDIINELKSSKDGEYKFIMSATGENHFPFNADKFDKYDIKITKSDFTEEENGMLLSYAQGIYDADRTLGILYDEIQKMDTPTIVVFYGDHFPYITNDAGEEVYIKSKYFDTDENTKDLLLHTTPVVLFSNYDVDFSDLEYISASYLGAYVLNKLDIDISSYFKYIDSLRTEIPIFNRNVYLDTTTKKYEYIDNAPENILKYINTYKYVQYYKFYELGNCCEKE